MKFFVEALLLFFAAPVLPRFSFFISLICFHFQAWPEEAEVALFVERRFVGTYLRDWKSRNVTMRSVTGLSILLLSSLEKNVFCMRSFESPLLPDKVCSKFFDRIFELFVGEF